MPDSSPVVTNAPNAERAGLAQQALTYVLAYHDPRVQTAEALWRARHDIHSLIDRVRHEPNQANARAVGEAILHDDPLDTLLLTQVLKDLELVVYPWLRSMLLGQWRTWALNDAMGEPRLTLSTTPRPRVQATSAPGESPTAFARRLKALERAAWLNPAASRRPKAGQTHREDIARNVDWFYRAEVKQPPDSIAAIAREYAIAAQRHTPAHSNVNHNIARAKDLLAFTCLQPTV